MTDSTNPPAYSMANPSPSVLGVQAYSGPVAGQNPPVIAMPAGQQYQVVTVAQSPRVYNSYASKQSLGLGITQVLAGIFCVVFNAVAIAFGALVSPASIGIWGGIMFILSGAFGISAAKCRTKCKVVTFMVLSIMSAAITLPLFICSIIGAIIDGYNFYCYTYYYYGYYSSNSCPNTRNVAVAMNSLLTILAFVEAVAAIWGSVICCKAACCCNSTENVAVPIQYATMQGQQVIIIQQPQLNYGGQLVAYPAPAGYTTQPIINAYPTQPMGNAYPAQPIGNAYPAQQITNTSYPTYPAQPMVNMAAPPYTVSYGVDSATAPAAHSNNTFNENMEKQAF